MELVKPIIVVGTGRCGSTAFHGVLAFHPDVAWLSNVLGKRPGSYWLHRLSLQLFDIPVAQPLFSKLVRPAEAYGLWNSWDPGFSRPMRDLTSGDVSNRVKERVRTLAQEVLTASRQRLLLKITGWPRIGYLAEIFPNARFIHLVRDGRAVASSLLDTEFWDGWRGPSNWRVGSIPEEMRLIWEESGRSFVVLAGIEWMILIDAVETGKHSIPEGQFLEVKYEDFANRPTELLRTVCEFSEIGWHETFATKIEAFGLHNMNYKWRQDLSKCQQIQLERALEGHLHQLGYS